MGSIIVLRCGDVVKAELIIQEPILTLTNLGKKFQIDIDVPKYSVVLTPCCSIEDASFSIAPLLKVKGDFFKNPYFASDLTLINRPLQANKLMSEDEWQKLPPQRQEEILSKETNYIQLQYFVYAENDVFEKYHLKGRDISYYMIDFKNIQRIKCDKIRRSDSKPLDETILKSKVLELSIKARRDLRDKITYFYSRVPKEDLEE